MPGPASAPPSRSRFRPGTRQIVALAVLALVVLFIVQNREPVRIALFAIVVTAPLWIMLTAMVLLGGPREPRTSRPGRRASSRNWPTSPSRGETKPPTSA